MSALHENFLIRIIQPLWFLRRWCQRQNNKITSMQATRYSKCAGHVFVFAEYIAYLRLPELMLVHFFAGTKCDQKRSVRKLDVFPEYFTVRARRRLPDAFGSGSPRTERWTDGDRMHATTSAPVLLTCGEIASAKRNCFILHSENFYQKSISFLLERICHYPQSPWLFWYLFVTRSWLIVEVPEQ